jgi:DNA-binding CsgD family transcriptional regulator
MPAKIQSDALAEIYKQDYERGLSIRQIAAKHQTTREKVKVRLKIVKTKMRAAKRTLVVKPDMRVAVAELETGKSPKEIAVLIGCSVNALKLRLKRLGKQLRKRGGSKTRGRASHRKHVRTNKEYDEQFQKQMGRCAICFRTESLKRKGKLVRMCGDHCHKTGARRDLLCSRCNKLTGLAHDDVQVLKSAIEYLEDHNNHGG